MERCDVFKEVEKANHQCISSRWVVTEQFKNETQVVKARPVARGFEDSRNLVRYSPIYSKLKRLFTIFFPLAAQWIRNLVCCTYLQGNMIDREVYLQLLKDLRRGVVWKLKHIYWLNDAPRAWYDKVRSELKRFGTIISNFNQAVFMWYWNEKLVGLFIQSCWWFFICWNWYMLGFPNSGKEWGKGKFPPIGVGGNQKFCWRGDIFTGWWEPKEEWFWPIKPFSKLKIAFCDDPCVQRVWN